MDVAIVCIVSKNVVGELSLKIYFVYQIIIYLTMGITVSKVADITSILKFLFVFWFKMKSSVIGLSRLKVRLCI